MSRASPKPSEIVAWLREDLAQFDAVRVCEHCNAKLYEADQYAEDDDGGAVCWPAIGAKEGKGRPCYKYRVAPADLPAMPRESAPYVPPYNRTLSLARGPVKSGVDRYMTPEIEARLKRLSGGGKP